MAQKPPAPSRQQLPTLLPLPVYEKQLGNIRFIFESAIDRGKCFKSVSILQTQSIWLIAKRFTMTTWRKFIQVTIGAQNEGTVNTDARRMGYRKYC